MKSNGEVVIVFLAGVVAGASVALLTTPQTGRRTRRQIRRKAEDVQAYLERLGEDLVEKGRELIERGRSVADDKVREIGAKVKEATF